MAQYKVLIPIVDKGHNEQLSGEERLWEVYCRPANGPELEEALQLKKDGLKPAIAPLQDVQHYNSSVHPYIAVERLLAAEAMHIQSPEQTLEHWRLFSGDGANWVAQIDGNSSNLGIALCLLMSCKHSDSRLVAATGALGDSQDSNDPQNSVVQPVANVDLKLRLLLEQKQQNKLPDALKLVITPHQQEVWQNGLKILEPVIKLPEVEQLNKLGITVHPVATLIEAAQVLGIDIEKQQRWFNRWRKFKQILRCSLATAVLSALLAAIWLGFSMNRPVALSFESIQANLAAAPFVVCRPPAGQARYAPITANRVVPAGSEIGWLLRLGDQSESAAWPYRIAKALGYQGLKPTLVLIGKQSGVRNDDNSMMAPDNKNRAIPPGRLWAYGWKLDQTEEDMLLAVLVNRWNALDIGQLKRGYSNIKDPDLAAIEQSLLKQADGGVSFRFKTQQGATNCDP